jgi:hypothetical protein
MGHSSTFEISDYQNFGLAEVCAGRRRYTYQCVHTAPATRRSRRPAMSHPFAPGYGAGFAPHLRCSQMRPYEART